jgi:uroporphyrin-III C-methyltransferase
VETPNKTLPKGDEGAAAPAADAAATPFAAATPEPAAPSPNAQPAALGLPTPWLLAAALVLALATIGALVLAWNTQQRVQALEAELVKRQQDSGNLASEARTLSREADTTAREAAAKVALVEARVAENVVQRTQLEELIQSMSRSRDENVLADVDAAIRVALQQTAITGSAEPLVLTLRQADERLARYNQPRLERVRRALAQDLERTRSAGVADINQLTLRLDEVIRVIDDLPLVSAPERRAQANAARVMTTPSAGLSGAGAATKPAAGGANSNSNSNSPAAQSEPSNPGLTEQLASRWAFFGGHVWQEVKGLIRISRIDQPEAALAAPEQAFFLRENTKLRLLNARLALLSRQFDSAQNDLRDVQTSLDRYFDRSPRRAAAIESVRQVLVQSRQVAVPRPDATLAAIATASAGR